MNSKQALNKATVKQTLKEYGRGIIGGLLFSLPLLYTMEVWWAGFSASPAYLLTGIIFTYLLLLGYNLYAGMRKDANFLAICWDSVEEIGLAILLSFLFLLLISKISFGMSFDELAGKVIVESMIVAIGISVGTAQLGQKKEKDKGTQENNGKENNLLKLSVLSICGAVLISSSVAPTQEILQISIESESVHLLLMVFLSLLLASIILYFSNFKGAKTGETKLKEMAIQVIIVYVLALMVSFVLLWFFGRVSGYSLFIIVAQTIVLAIPGTLGAAAGRLLIGR